MKLIKNLTSFVSGTGNKWFGRKNERLISAKAAKKIQKSAYEHSCSPDNCYTPPYMEIAGQLNAKNEQIFQAAVLNLYKIARASKEYRAEILEILAGQPEKRKLSIEAAAYLNDKIVRLRKL